MKVARAPALGALAIAVRASALALSVAVAGCAAHAAPPAIAQPPAATTMRVIDGRPPIAAVIRDGDPRGAVSVAVLTTGIASSPGAEVAAALAGVVEARLEARGIASAQVAVSLDGYRVRALVATAAEAAAVVEALRTAMTTPVAGDAAAMRRAEKKLTALAKMPLGDPALLDAARCTGEAFGASGIKSANESEIESWRRAAHGLGRVAFATTGAADLAESASDALARGAAWPTATPLRIDATVRDSRSVVYDAAALVPPGSARLTIVARADSAAQAVHAAEQLGDDRGPLASRLRALDAPAQVERVDATAHADGGCVAVTLSMGARELERDAPARVATAVALARQEIAVELSEADRAAAHGVTDDAGDPRDAAERAAWWAITSAATAGARTGAAARAEPQIGVAIGVSDRRDAPSSEGVTGRAPAILAELDRTLLAWHAHVVEGRTRVERGQGELWMIVASPCGTDSEVESDAGLAAAVASAVAAQARARAGADVRIEPLVSPDAVGLLVHGAARPGETAAAHARRLADAAARSFAADPLEPAFIARARAQLVVHATDLDARALGALGDALAPGHPSWTAPFGTVAGIGRSSDEAIAIRASALRAGPLRVAVIANGDAAQAEIAVRAVDRWVARRAGESRACAALADLAARPGTYAIDARSPLAEAWLAYRIAPGDDAGRAAHVIAAALDGDGGLLARALGEAGLARSFGAHVLTGARAPALVVRVVAADAQLDAAVLQTRALLDRLRQGALSEADRTRAAARDDGAALSTELEPRGRVLALFRGTHARAAAPSLDALRGFAARTFREDALIVVAARPSRSRTP